MNQFPERGDEASALSDRAPSAPLHIGLDERYERLQMIGWWDQSRIHAARVMVVGAGALGNEVIKNLALLGTGLVVVIDFDQIEASNLSRSVLFRDADCGRTKAEAAAAMARQINPDCRAVPVVGRIPDDTGLGLIEAMDLVIGCVDNREARLWINRLCWRAGKPWIDGGIQEISGVAKVFAPPGHPAHAPGSGCYECTMTDNDYRLIQLRYSCPLLSREELQQGRVPTAPTIASIIGGLQVQEALKLLHGLPSAAGSGLVFNGAANRFYQTAYPSREDCLSHERVEQVVGLDRSVKSTTARELLRIALQNEPHATATESPRPALLPSNPAASEHPASSPSLQLDRDFVLALHCGTCGTETAVNQPVSRVSAKSAVCPQCNGDRRPELIHEVGFDSPAIDFSLAALGVPAWDVARVRRGPARHVWFRFDADRPEWLPGSPAGEAAE
jgi:molybdopterin/thiamine biosynthesis adenylyltransferase